MIKRLLGIAALLCLVVTSAGAAVLDNAVIKVGTESTYPPYESRDDKNNLVGFDIEVDRGDRVETRQKGV